MTHITVDKASPETLQPLRGEHLTKVSAPLDGMWESFVDQGQHHAILIDKKLIGYCVLNEERQVIQFHVSDEQLAAPMFKMCIQQLDVAGAVVASCDPLFFAQALDHQKGVRVNALMYQHDATAIVAPLAFDPTHSFKLAKTEGIDEAVAFAEAAIGAPKEWLTQYYGERIDRQELWLLLGDGKILAAGECRISPHQHAVADVGMVVAEGARGKGIATRVLQALVGIARTAESLPICSTEASNIGAQKAIERAGFTSLHRIVEFDF